MSDSIEIGDIVQVDFNGAQITLCREAEVMYKPQATGDSWIFKARDTGFIYHVSEGCTISRKASHNNTAKEQQSTIDSLNEIVEAVIKYRDFDGLCEVETESDLWGEVVGLLEQHNKDKP